MYSAYLESVHTLANLVYADLFNVLPVPPLEDDIVDAIRAVRLAFDTYATKGD